MLSSAVDNIACTEALIKDNRLNKLQNMAMELDLPKLIVHKIIHEKFGYQKVSSYWVLKNNWFDSTFFEEGICILLHQSW